MTHTPECQAEINFQTTLRAAWVARWPNYCRACNGHGECSWLEDPSPAGVSLSPGLMRFSEPCPVCTEQGVCPRCGTHGLTEDGEGPCSACEWNYNSAMPAEPECICPIGEGEQP